jgi:hypothetical protein
LRIGVDFDMLENTVCLDRIKRMPAFGISEVVSGSHTTSHGKPILLGHLLRLEINMVHQDMRFCFKTMTTTTTATMKANAPTAAALISAVLFAGDAGCLAAG